jgi:hypothetical protein
VQRILASFPHRPRLCLDRNARCRRWRSHSVRAASPLAKGVTKRGVPQRVKSRAVARRMCFTQDSGARSVFDTPRFARLRLCRSRSVSVRAASRREGEGLARQDRRRPQRDFGRKSGLIAKVRFNELSDFAVLFREL